jgi:hypothetical protein
LFSLSYMDYFGGSALLRLIVPGLPRAYNRLTLVW